MSESQHSSTRNDQRPNIIMIITDQQRYDTIRSLGFPHMETPHLDKLVEEGTAFTHSFITAPSCAPSRASLFTGLYPHTNGVFINSRDPWPENMVGSLSDSGYYCVNIGKMHTEPWDAKLGYHERYVVENKDRFRADRWFFDEWDKALRIRGVEKPSRASYSEWDDYEERLGAYEWQLPEDLHPDFFVGDLAAWWINKNKSRWWDKPNMARSVSGSTSVLDKPLFLQIGFPGPHPPYDPVPEFIDTYMKKDLPIAEVSSNALEKEPQGLKKLREIMLRDNPDGIRHLANPTKEQRHKQRAYYLANVSMIDKKVGEILEALHDNGYLENSIVVFTSDHGDCLGDHGHSQKWNMYDEVTRVPTIFWGPKYIKSGQTVDDLIEIFDICPTLLEFANIEIPSWMEAASLVPMLHGDSQAEGKEYVFAEHAKDNFLPTVEYMTMVRSKEWKLVHFLGEQEGQLFNLVEDPGEITDLWDDADYAGIKQNLLSVLRERNINSDVKTRAWRNSKK